MNSQLQARIEEIEKRCEKASPDWSARCKEFSNTGKPRFIFSDPYGWVGEFFGISHQEDAAFVAASRKDVPFLISELRRAYEELDLAKERLGPAGWKMLLELKKSRFPRAGS